MVAIVTRAGKGSPLTNAEVDANFTNLDNGKVETTFAGVVAALGFTPANKAGDTFTGNVVVNGSLGVGTSSITNYSIRVGRNLTGGTNAFGISMDANVNSDVTATAVYNRAQLNTAAAAFTLSTAILYQAAQNSIGAGSSVTNVNGFVADNSLSGATATYGFRGLLNSGSGRWNLFMSGTAANFLGGDTIINAALGFGASGSPSYGTANQILTSQGSGAVPSWQSVRTVNGNSILGSGNIQIDGGVTSFNTRTGAVTLSSGDVTTALGFTPYNATNPSGYIDTNGTARVIVENNGTLVGTRRALNFIPGTGISLAISDDSANEEVDITITSTVTGGVTSFNTRTGAVTLSSGDVTTALGYTPLSTGGGTLTGNLVFGNATSPNTNFIQFGDNSGWTLRFMTNVSGTPTQRYAFTDTGNFTATGNVTAFSDERLKADWSAVPADFVERLSKVKSGTYTRIDSGERQAGASAQDWQTLLPEVVQAGTDDAKTLSLAYGNAALVSAIELAKRVVQLEAKLAKIIGEG